MDHAELREAVAKAICRAYFYCDLDKPDGLEHWRKNKDRCLKEADGALSVIGKALKEELTDIRPMHSSAGWQGAIDVAKSRILTLTGARADD